jgi:hypothetical protein
MDTGSQVWVVLNMFIFYTNALHFNICSPPLIIIGLA